MRGAGGVAFVVEVGCVDLDDLAFEAAFVPRPLGVLLRLEAERVRVLTGNAAQLLDSTAGEFDLIFNDVDKTQYPEVFRKAVARVRVGGLFITDNVLWSGRVALPPEAAFVEFEQMALRAD